MSKTGFQKRFKTLAFFLKPYREKMGCGELWLIGSKTLGSCTGAVFAAGCRWWRHCILFLLNEIWDKHEFMPFPLSWAALWAGESKAWWLLRNALVIKEIKQDWAGIKLTEWRICSFVDSSGTSLVFPSEIFCLKKAVPDVLFLSCSVSFLWFGLTIFYLANFQKYQDFLFPLC